MRIDAIVNDIIRRETDQFTDRTADKGGPTKFGITLATLTKSRGRPTTRQDVMDLTREEAVEIYKAQYIGPWAFMEDSLLRDVLIDWGVTSHQRNPIKALQTWINSIGYRIVEADGVMGPKTQAAWKETIVAFPNLLPQAANEIAKDRAIFYARLSLKDEATKRFMAEHPEVDLHNLIGWLNRALEFL